MKQDQDFIKQRKNSKRVIVALSLLVCLSFGIAYATSSQDLASVANQIRTNFSALAKLITAAAYIAGFGFAFAAILKFKAHKDNPTQIPVGTPIALLFIAAALIFLPSIFNISGATLFGTEAKAGGISGITSLPGQ